MSAFRDDYDTTWRCAGCLAYVPIPPSGKGPCANCGRMICDPKRAPSVREAGYDTG